MKESETTGRRLSTRFELLKNKILGFSESPRPKSMVEQQPDVVRSGKDVHKHSIEAEATENADNERRLILHCKKLCSEFAAAFHAKLPRELRYIVYDYLISDLRSSLGVRPQDSLLYSHYKLRKIHESNNYIFLSAWVGPLIATEAASYFYSQTQWNLPYVQQIEEFIITPFDIFGYGLDPKALIRSMEVTVHYNRAVNWYRHCGPGWTNVTDGEIKELREAQIRSLEKLNHITHTEGFRLVLLVNASRLNLKSRIQALDVLKEIGPTLFMLKEKGMRISIAQNYKFTMDVDSCFTGWLDGTLEEWGQRIEERRGESISVRVSHHACN